MSRLFTNPVPEISNSPGFLTSTLNAGLSGISLFGNILDTPGSVIRGLAAGEPGRAFSGIFDFSDRVSGSELLGHDPDKFTLSGFGAEVLTDPFTFLTAGSLTLAGKLSKRATHLKHTVEALESFSKTGVTPPAGTVKRLENARKGLDEVLAEAKSRGLDLDVYKKNLSERLESGQAAGLSFSIPFVMKPVPVADLAPIAKPVNFAENILGKATSPFSGLKNKFSTREDNPVMEALRQEFNRLNKESRRKAVITREELAKRLNLLESANPNIDIKNLSIRLVEELGDNLDKISVSTNPRFKELLKTKLAVEEEYGAIPDAVWDFAREINHINKELLATEQGVGVAVSELSDLGYFTRHFTREGLEVLQKSQAGRKEITKFLESQGGGLTGGFQKQRLFKEIPLDKLEAQLRKKYNKPDSFNFFDKDLVRSQVSRSLTGEFQANRARLAQATVDLFGKTKGKSGAERIIGKARIKDKAGRTIRGPLVTSTRMPVVRDLNAFVKNQVKRGSKVIKSGDGLSFKGFTLMKDSDKILQTYSRFGGTSKKAREAFQALSDTHAAMDERFDFLVKEGVLTGQQAGLLRVLTAQLDDDALEILREREGWKLNIDLTDDPQSLGFADAHDSLGEPNIVNSLTPAGHLTSGFPKNIESAEIRLNPKNLKKNEVPTVFLHEIGHVLSFSLIAKNPEIASKIDEAFDLVRSKTTDFNGGVDVSFQLARLFEKTGFSGRLGSPGMSAYYASEPQEWFAETFSRWMLGTRVPDKSLNNLYRAVGNEFQAWRELIADTGRFEEGGFSKGLGITEDIPDVTEFFPELLVQEDKAINLLPYGDRTKFIAEMMEPEWTREAYIDIPVNATDEQIRALMKENGVVSTKIDEEIWDSFQRITKTANFMPDKSTLMGKFINVSDQIHGLYRTALTQYFPAFHARNFISNVFLNALGGVGNPKHYLKALKHMREMDPDEMVYLAGLGVLDEGKIKESWDILAQSSGSIKDATKKFLGTPKVSKAGGKTALQLGGSINKNARAFGQFIENHTRMAHYLAKKEAGLSDIEAADSVAKYLFDYSDLTDFERAVPRRTILFYTFMRKNLPLMMEKVFTDPRFMVNYARITGRTNLQIAQPEWMPDSFFLGEDEKGRSIRANFGLPPEDLARFDPDGEGLARVFQILISNMVPAIKEPFQFISGHDLFLNQPIEGGLSERLAAAAPTARVTSSGARIIKSASGETDRGLGEELTRLLTGVNIRRIDPAVQRKINALEQIRDRQKELVRQGKARSIEIVGQRKDHVNEELTLLNRLRSQLQADLN